MFDLSIILPGCLFLFFYWLFGGFREKKSSATIERERRELVGRDEKRMKDISRERAEEFEHTGVYPTTYKKKSS